MQSNNIFCGVDVSKDTIDCSLVNRPKQGQFNRKQFANTRIGRKEFISWLTKQSGKQEPLVCLEHTGLYAYVVARSLYEREIPVWMENALHIKRSGGLQRGKNDKVDADRIADFCMRHSDQVRLWKPMSANYQQLKDIMDVMETIKQTLASLRQPIKELKDMELFEEAARLEEALKDGLAGLESALEKQEAKLDELLKEDKEISDQCRLLQSVDGIGRHTALVLIYFTEGFTRFTDVKQFAAYCGVVPYEHSSGTSVRKGSHVSHLAQKKLKTTLHMAAMGVVHRKDGELKEYYLRKVEEGKNKMSVINALRHKILQRAFSVIRRKEPYVRHRSDFVDKSQKNLAATA